MYPTTTVNFMLSGSEWKRFCASSPTRYHTYHHSSLSCPPPSTFRWLASCSTVWSFWPQWGLHTRRPQDYWAFVYKTLAVCLLINGIYFPPHPMCMYLDVKLDNPPSNSSSDTTCVVYILFFFCDNWSCGWNLAVCVCSTETAEV